MKFLTLTTFLALFVFGILAKEENKQEVHKCNSYTKCPLKSKYIYYENKNTNKTVYYNKY